MLVFHIGLPKTATTYLQHRIFKPAYRDSFFHRSSPTAGKCVREIRRRIQDRNFNPNELSPATVEWLRDAARAGSGMVSDENISSRGRDFWNGQGVSPEEVCECLYKLRKWTGLEDEKFGILLGIRCQDQFLASRYAQSAYQASLRKNFDYNQEDFDRKIDRILDKGRSLPAYRWLYYDDVRKLFGEYFGSKAFIYSMDALEREQSQTLEKLGRFCGKDLIQFAENPRRKGGSAITRKVAKNEWSIWGNQTISIDDDFTRTIRRHFGHHYLVSRATSFATPV